MIYLIRCFSRRFQSTLIDFGSQMKRLNDNGQFEKVIALYEDEIRKEHKQNSSFVVSQALKACIELGDIKRGKDIHKSLSSVMANNQFIENDLIRLYMKCDDYEKSKQIFMNSKNKTTVMFNNILIGLADNHRYEEALNLFKESNITTNEYTLSTLFKICAEIGDQDSLEFGTLLFNRMPETFHNNIVVVSSAILMFTKCGDISKAEVLFNRIEKKNLIVFGVMMNGYVSNKMEERAIELFFKVPEPDKIMLNIFFSACAQLKSPNALNLAKKVFDQYVVKSYPSNDLLCSVLNMFIKCDDLQSAEILFNRINRNIISYGSMMKFYNTKDQPEKTLELYQRMKQENLIPNEIVFTLLIDACSKLGDLSLSQRFINEIPHNFLLDPYIQIGLIDLWGKVGSPDKSKEIFDTIEHPDSFTFAAMINAYGLNGMGIEAIKLFNKVPSNMLDDCIYVCVLNACSHSALVDQACNIFEKVPFNQRTDQIVTAIVDTFSRVFRFDEAQKLIDEYEKSHNPYIPMNMALLSSTRNAKNISLSEKIFQRMEYHFPKNESCLKSARVLLANTYALTGDKSMSAKIRMQLNQSTTKKVVGCSSTVVDGKVYKFRAHDRSHPRSSEIYEELDRLTKQLIEHGYKHDESWITREIGNDETAESILCGHSERLAIGFNLIQRPIPTRIQIVKNLRVCGDCHFATKLIAKIHQCSIIVRDANRIHHFYPNGTCSCHDHF